MRRRRCAAPQRCAGLKARGVGASPGSDSGNAVPVRVRSTRASDICADGRGALARNASLETSCLAGLLIVRALRSASDSASRTAGAVVTRRCSHDCGVALSHAPAPSFTPSPAAAHARDGQSCARAPAAARTSFRQLRSWKVWLEALLWTTRYLLARYGASVGGRKRAVATTPHHAVFSRHERSELSGMPVRWCLLIRSLRPVERQELHSDLMVRFGVRSTRRVSGVPVSFFLLHPRAFRVSD